MEEEGIWLTEGVVLDKTEFRERLLKDLKRFKKERDKKKEDEIKQYLGDKRKSRL